MKLPTLILTLCLALAIVAAGCGSSSDSSSSSPESSVSKETTESTESPPTTEKSTALPPTAEKASPVTTDKKKPTVTVPTSLSPEKFQIKDLEKGTGPSVKSGDTVTIQYVVVGYDSKKEVDSSWERKPYTYTVGSGAALEGGERGIQGMKVGGRREMIVPGDLAYGSAGTPEVAPNETLVLMIDLLAVQ